jgi:hypothetical protein
MRSQVFESVVALAAVGAPLPKLLGGMETNNASGAGERPDAEQEHSESGKEVQGFCVRTGPLDRRPTVGTGPALISFVLLLLALPEPADRSCSTV